ncbi:MAG: phosphoglycerate kinase, partial [Cardiobacterium hominis]
KQVQAINEGGADWVYVDATDKKLGQFGIEDKVDYISTGGGSMLEYLEGKKLPGLEILGAY